MKLKQSTLRTNTTRGILFLFGLALFLGATNWNSSRADDRDSYASWVGEWEVTVDGKEKITLTLQQSRRGLYGKYTPGNGQATGRVYEGVLRLRCYENEKLKSSAQLKLSEDKKSFSGASKNAGEDKEHAWSGVRK